MKITASRLIGLGRFSSDVVGDSFHRHPDDPSTRRSFVSHHRPRAIAHYLGVAMSVLGLLGIAGFTPGRRRRLAGFGLAGLSPV